MTSLDDVQNLLIDGVVKLVPSQVRVDPLRKYGLYISKFFGAQKNVTLDDHSDEEHASGWFNFISAATLHYYLEKTDKPVLSQEVCHDSGCNIPLTVLNRSD